MLQMFPVTLAALVTLAVATMLAVPAAAPAHPRLVSHDPNPGGTVRNGLQPPQGAHYLNPPPIMSGPKPPNVPPRH